MDDQAVGMFEGEYCSDLSPAGIRCSQIIGHVRYLEDLLAKAIADPGYLAHEPGVIQPDKDEPGKFTFRPTSAMVAEAEGKPEPPEAPGKGTTGREYARREAEAREADARFTKAGKAKKP